LKKEVLKKSILYEINTMVMPEHFLAECKHSFVHFYSSWRSKCIDMEYAHYRNYSNDNKYKLIRNVTIEILKIMIMI
jgi:hypothetical protein